MNKIKRISFLLSMLVFASVFADGPAVITQPGKGVPAQWSGNIQFGGVNNTGNSTSYSYNGATSIQFLKNVWLTNFNAQLQAGGSKSGGMTSKTYGGSIQTKYFFVAPTCYVYSLGNYTFDAFNTYRDIYTVSVGYGKRVINRKNMTLDLQGGPGYDRKIVQGNNQIINNYIVFLSGNLTYQLSSDIQFTQSVEMTKGQPNLYIETNTAFSSTIIKNLALQVSFTMKRNSYIPSYATKRKKVDTITNLSVVYSF